MSAPDLVSKPLAQITTFWRPGSRSDNWTWADEYAELIDHPVTAAVHKRVDNEGIDFADKFAPVLLGSDGRVWDGHHRIVIAIKLGLASLMVETAGGSDD